MSNMKQVVYAGAFGALVAMQGCGEDAPQQEVAVAADGTQSLQQAAQEVITEAEKKFESFNAETTFKEVEKFAEEQGLDVKAVEEQMGDLKKMDPHQMSRKAHEVIEKVMANEDVAKTFEEVQSKLSDVFAFITKSQQLSKADAIKEINTICPKPEKDITKEEAKTLVQALETMYNTTTDNAYCADVDAALAKCKAGFQWSSLPCFGVHYNQVSVATIKARQNIDQVQKEEPKEEPKEEELKEGETVKAETVKAAKKPAKKVVTKNIYAVMPTDLKNVQKPEQVFEWIVEQVGDAEKVDKPALMSLAQAVKARNAALKQNKKPANKAVQKGKKVAEKAEAAVEEAKAQAQA
jgi:hypothetical protein